MAEKKKSWLRSLMGKHLIEMARATDADPDKIMDAAEALNEEANAKDEVEVPKNTQVNEFKSEDKKAKDGELPEALKEHEIKAKDNNEDGGAMDAKAADRKAAHDALDKILDKRKANDAKAKDSAKAADSNVAALKTLLDEFLTEEESEPEHSEDAVDPVELEELLGEEDCPDCGEAHDSEECPGESEGASGEENIGDAEEGESPDPDSDDDQADVEPADDKARAKDRARAADAAMATLRLLRPFAARSNDKAFQATFNRALDSVKKSSRTSTGGYGKFAASARARDKAPRNPNPDRARAGDSGKSDPIAKMQEFYNTAHKGGK